MSKTSASRRRSLGQVLRHLVHIHVWKMDIASTAWISPSAYVDRTNPRGIHIGANCCIDHQAVILSHDMTRGIRPNTCIGEDTTVGARAVIMPGIHVGRDCRILPGAVVTKDVPDGAHVVGNPARLVDS